MYVALPHFTTTCVHACFKINTPAIRHQANHRGTRRLSGCELPSPRPRLHRAGDREALDGVLGDGAASPEVVIWI